MKIWHNVYFFRRILHPTRDQRAVSWEVLCKQNVSAMLNAHTHKVNFNKDQFRSEVSLFKLSQSNGCMHWMKCNGLCAVQSRWPGWTLWLLKSMSGGFILMLNTNSII